MAAWWDAAGHAAGPSLPSARIDIGAVPLADAVSALGAQAGVTIGIDDAGLGAVRVRPFHRRASASEALSRMLRGTPAEAHAAGDRAFRIERRMVAPVRPQPAPARDTPDAIVVTGSKRDTSLASYSGSVVVVDASTIPLAMRAHGSEALVSEVPILSSTHLGSGRNKLFIRGIADSSFNGPSQGTVGQYLGEARLTYNAPDPDLALYDIAKTEILEGPQGTLYGAGTLGGIVRLDPNMPDLGKLGLGLSLGGTSVRHGAAGFDAAGLVNLPLVRDVAGIRVLAYASSDGGYIDDPGRALHDINVTHTHGGRAEFRLRPAPSWTIDVTGVIQDIKASDGNYADRSLPRLMRDSAIAQPFDNDYSLANIVVRHPVGSVDMTSSTTYVHHDVTSAYDATVAGGAPRLFLEEDHIHLVTNETRLARRYADGSNWVIGLEALANGDRIRRWLGPPTALSAVSGSRNSVFEAALFGEGTLAITRSLSVTAGGRLAYSRLVGEVLEHVGEAPEPNRHGIVFLPSVATLWRVSPALALFARYQEGFRQGGLSVSNDLVKRYRGDGLSTVEGGLRLGSAGARVEATAAVSYASWKNIQADLVGADGLPLTTNVGNGRVLGLEASIRWRPARSLDLSGSVFVNDSSLDDPAAGFEGERDASLPNVDDLGFSGRADYRLMLGAADALHVHGALRYVGGSRLAVGTAFDFPQGHYVATDAGLRWDHQAISVTLDVSNLLDDGRNQFALGNPFQLAGGRQITPLVPRSFRLGLSTGF